VSATLEERAGVIVVRAWLESDGHVRARVTATDFSLPAETVSSAEGNEEIVALVRAWLERFVGPASNSSL
jgi:hypothetical protein